MQLLLAQTGYLEQYDNILCLSACLSAPWACAFHRSKTALWTVHVTAQPPPTFVLSLELSPECFQLLQRHQVEMKTISGTN